MICRNCGHEIHDHDHTFRLCAGEVFDSRYPMATRCAKECRSFVEMKQYDTDQESA